MELSATKYALKYLIYNFGAGSPELGCRVYRLVEYNQSLSVYFKWANFQHPLKMIGDEIMKKKKYT